MIAPMWVEVEGFKRARKDVKSMSWYPMPADYAEDPVLYELDNGQRLLMPYLRGKCCKAMCRAILVSVTDAASRCKATPEDMLAALTYLEHHKYVKLIDADAAAAITSEKPPETDPEQGRDEPGAKPARARNEHVTGPLRNRDGDGAGPGRGSDEGGTDPQRIRSPKTKTKTKKKTERKTNNSETTTTPPKLVVVDGGDDSFAGMTALGLAALWNELRGPLARSPKTLNAAEVALAEAALAEEPRPDYWRDLFEHVAKTPFLTGKVKTAVSPQGFRARFAWAVEKHAGIAAGDYDGHEPEEPEPPACAACGDSGRLGISRGFEIGECGCHLCAAGERTRMARWSAKIEESGWKLDRDGEAPAHDLEATQ